MFADTAFTRKIDSLETGEIKLYLIIVSPDIIWVFPRHLPDKGRPPGINPDKCLQKTHPVVVRDRSIIIQYQDEQNGQLSVSLWAICHH